MINQLLDYSAGPMGIYEILIFATVNTLLMFFASFKFVQTLQQSGYDGRGYLSWLKRRDNIYMLRLLIVSLLSILAFLSFNVAAMIFSDKEQVIYIGFLFYLMFFSFYTRKDRRTKSKVPLVKTNRVKRLLLTYVLIVFFVQLLVMMLVNLIAYTAAIDTHQLLFRLRYGVLCLSPLSLPFAVIAAYYVNEPFERYNKRSYVAKCKEALNARPDLIRIGITGSYGKTSVKEILSTVLSQKYSVLATPYSFNTPMGVCKTVKNLKSSHQVFIAEMGARRTGEIRELAEIVKPDIAVLTGVVGQHIETFGSIANIKNTKYELVESLADDGYAVFSADNAVSVDLSEKCLKTHVLAGINEKHKEVYAEDISVSVSGTRFTLCVNGERVECSTVPIGTHNVSNICMAAAVAARLGMTAAEIAAGINRVKPIKHRLEVLGGNTGVTVIDDSFNANVKGTIAAMEVLDCFEGRKIIITPGLVELGDIEEHANYMFGVRMSSHVDIAILVGKRRVGKIKDGLLSEGFPKENVYVVKDLAEGKRLLKDMVKDGDVIIFENDLPDKFN